MAQLLIFMAFDSEFPKENAPETRLQVLCRECGHGMERKASFWPRALCATPAPELGDVPLCSALSLWEKGSHACVCQQVLPLDRVGQHLCFGCSSMQSLYLW